MSEIPMRYAVLTWGADGVHWEGNSDDLADLQVTVARMGADRAWVVDRLVSDEAEQYMPPSLRMDVR